MAKKQATQSGPKTAQTKLHPNADRRPDASSETVSKYAQSLADLVRRDLRSLAEARVDAGDASALEAQARALDEAEAQWTTLADRAQTGSVEPARDALRTGRDLLFDALDTYAEKPATQKVLREIAGVVSDEDLVRDTVRLLPLAKRHAKDLVGTPVTPAKVVAVEASLEAFRKARKGERDGADAENRQAESRSLLAARRARNVAFWELAETIRRVVKRGRFAFREDAKKRESYVVYNTARSTRGGGASPAQPTKPVDSPKG